MTIEEQVKYWKMRCHVVEERNQQIIDEMNVLRNRNSLTVTELERWNIDQRNRVRLRSWHL